MSSLAARAAGPSAMLFTDQALWEAHRSDLEKVPRKEVQEGGMQLPLSIGRETPTSLPAHPSPLSLQPALCPGSVGTLHQLG